MRQTILSLLAFGVPFLWRYVWTQWMKSAPLLVGNIVTVVFLLAAIAWFLFSDPVYGRISNPKEYVLSSTLLIAFASAVVGATLWCRMAINLFHRRGRLCA
jgi:hypothetical protein